MIPIPSHAQTVLTVLEQNGYEAYLVGGCVRDSLLGDTPSDYDITTNATPQQVLAAFSAYHTVETGLQHGTVTVVIDSVPMEVTTFRIDGDYHDNRRPDCVTFTGNLRDDLARRDFTVNAMAYRPSTGLVDCFGGQQDLRARLIRCVGVPDIRFGEDALRILRALRFAAVLGFTIEPETAKSIHKNKLLLKHIAAERIQTEFFKLLCGINPAPLLDEYRDVLAVFLPEITAMFGFAQHTKYHDSDVWHHSLRALASIEAHSLPLRLAAFLHDIGKPARFTMDEDGVGHFYGHAKQSVELARNLLNRLKCDNATKHAVLTLIEYHDAELAPTKKSVKRWLGRLGPELFFDLLHLQAADSMAHAAPYVEPRLEALGQIRTLAQEVLDEGACFSLRDLAVDGHDMMALGLSGRQIGAALNDLLALVIDGVAENEKTVLLNAARGWIEKTNNLNT